MNIRNIIRTGILRLLYSKTELQELQIDMLSGETRDKLEQALLYGFAHRPHAGAEAVTVFPDGDQGFGLVLSVYDRRYRLKLEEDGEVAIYDDIDQKVHLTRDGIVLSSPRQVKIDTPTSTFTGNVLIEKKLFVNDDANIAGKSFNTHYHQHGSPNTSKPIGD